MNIIKQVKRVDITRTHARDLFTVQNKPLRFPRCRRSPRPPWGRRSRCWSEWAWGLELALAFLLVGPGPRLDWTPRSGGSSAGANIVDHKMRLKRYVQTDFRGNSGKWRGIFSRKCEKTDTEAGSEWMPSLKSLMCDLIRFPIFLSVCWIVCWICYERSVPSTWVLSESLNLHFYPPFITVRPYELIPYY